MSDGGDLSAGKQWLSAAGQLFAFLPPLVLLVATTYRQPWLLFGVVFLVVPAARWAFGAVPAGAPTLWSEPVAVSLHALPTVYVLVLFAAVLQWLVVIPVDSVSIGGAVDGSIGAAVGWTLSLWLVMVFATCAAHELLHRRTRAQRLLGSVVAGVAGYPLMAYDHGRHHRLAGNTRLTEWPAVDDSFVSFGSRRLQRLVRECFAANGLLYQRDWYSPGVLELRVGVSATSLTLLAFTVAAGWMGAVIYATVAALVCASQQLITYLQHWGLGDDSIENAGTRECAWEDDCRFLAWLTFGLSLHQTHHRDASRPYYRIGLTGDAPRPPAGYLFLMFVALAPPLWRRVMMPALTHWKANPAEPLSAGRRLVCVAAYKPLVRPRRD